MPKYTIVVEGKTYTVEDNSIESLQRHMDTHVAHVIEEREQREEAVRYEGLGPSADLKNVNNILATGEPLEKYKGKFVRESIIPRG